MNSRGREKEFRGNQRRWRIDENGGVYIKTWSNEYPVVVLSRYKWQKEITFPFQQRCHVVPICAKCSLYLHGKSS